MWSPGRSEGQRCRRSWLLSLTMIMSSLACAGKPEGTPATSSGASRAGTSEAAPLPEEQIAAGQFLYLPAYSHVLTADNAQPLNLAVTLYVRNTDPRRSILLTRVQYNDSSGKPVRTLLSKPLRIEPLASTEYFIKENDESGGASPNFLVEWVSGDLVSDPIVETVMIGTAGTQGIAFTGESRELSRRKPQ